jgi:hypothetical protein
MTPAPSAFVPLPSSFKQAHCSCPLWSWCYRTGAMGSDSSVSKDNVLRHIGRQRPLSCTIFRRPLEGLAHPQTHPSRIARTSNKVASSRRCVPDDCASSSTKPRSPLYSSAPTTASKAAWWASVSRFATCRRRSSSSSGMYIPLALLRSVHPAPFYPHYSSAISSMIVVKIVGRLQV